MFKLYENTLVQDLARPSRPSRLNLKHILNVRKKR